MKLILKSLLYFVFIISIFTSLNALIGGAANITDSKVIIPSAIDSEVRCMSVFWLAFGGFCFLVAGNLNQYSHFVSLIALVLFFSGCARLLSFLSTGMPGAPLFLAMIIEFILSIVIFYICILSKKKFPTGLQS